MEEREAGAVAPTLLPGGDPVHLHPHFIDQNKLHGSVRPRHLHRSRAAGRRGWDKGRTECDSLSLHQVEFVSELPKTITGKIKRDTLRKREYGQL